MTPHALIWSGTRTSPSPSARFLRQQVQGYLFLPSSSPLRYSQAAAPTSTQLSREGSACAKTTTTWSPLDRTGAGHVLGASQLPQRPRLQRTAPQLASMENTSSVVNLASAARAQEGVNHRKEFVRAAEISTETGTRALIVRYQIKPH